MRGKGDGASSRGPSILETLWEALDAEVDALMGSSDERSLDEVKGTAYGIAYAIALMTNPYQINVDAIRAIAMERHAERI